VRSQVRLLTNISCHLSNCEINLTRRDVLSMSQFVGLVWRVRAWSAARADKEVSKKGSRSLHSHQHRSNLRHLNRIHGFKTYFWNTFQHYFFSLLLFFQCIFFHTGLLKNLHTYYFSHSAICRAHAFFILSVYWHFKTFNLMGFVKVYVTVKLIIGYCALQSAIVLSYLPKDIKTP
jgi:hypothetical protein